MCRVLTSAQTHRLEGNELPMSPLRLVQCATLAALLAACGSSRKTTPAETVQGGASRTSFRGADYIRIEPGGFVMGSPDDEPGRTEAEMPLHDVEITHAFYLKATEVTQGEWESVMGHNPSRFRGCGANCPVERVSWFDCVAYLNALSRREGLPECYRLVGCEGTSGGGCADGAQFCFQDYQCKKVEFAGLECSGYRLPTEEEWEYAARAGTTGALYTGGLTIRGTFDGPELDAIAWYGGNSGATYDDARDCSSYPQRQVPAPWCGPQPVARKLANGFGLYDMLGNVSEWVNDSSTSKLQVLEQVDGEWVMRDVKKPLGSAPAEIGGYRNIRGGSWTRTAAESRIAYREYSDSSVRNFMTGLRPARSVVE